MSIVGNGSGPSPMVPGSEQFIKISRTTAYALAGGAFTLIGIIISLTLAASSTLQDISSNVERLGRIESRLGSMEEKLENLTGNQGKIETEQKFVNEKIRGTGNEAAEAALTKIQPAIDGVKSDLSEISAQADAYWNSYKTLRDEDNQYWQNEFSGVSERQDMIFLALDDVKVGLSKIDSRLSAAEANINLIPGALSSINNITDRLERIEMQIGDLNNSVLALNRSLEIYERERSQEYVRLRNVASMNAHDVTNIFRIMSYGLDGVSRRERNEIEALIENYEKRNFDIQTIFSPNK